ncbi:MAG: hypothetical protein R3234_09985 [Thermoanaerobaculia bacterium]|nr:hypothetical protein [Thermoanaerobaculia bacterium]
MEIAEIGRDGERGTSGRALSPSLFRSSVRRLFVPVLTALTLTVVSCTGSAPPDPAGETSVSLRNPLLFAEPEVLLREGDVVLLRWEIDDEPILWQPGPHRLRHLENWRRAIQEAIGEDPGPRTDPRYLIRRNRELYPWLESENEAVGRINRRVESGKLGRLRPMNGLESFLLDFHAARYPLVAKPSELGALILSRPDREGPRLRVYYLTDGDGLPPKRGVRTVLESAHRDLGAGWDLRTFLHNHTFDLGSERGMLAIAAPSPSDVHFIRTVIAPLKPDEAWIVDGFHSIELDPADLAGLELPGTQTEED